MLTSFYTIAGIKISLKYNPERYGILLDKSLDSFASPPFDMPDILFRIETESAFPPLDSYRKLFTSHPKGLWAIFDDTRKSHYLITFQDVEGEEKPYKIVKADREFTDFIIYSKPTQNNIVSPLEYPLEELVVSGHINLNRIGILLHSACISLDGRGYLFSGVSGSGKSTISKFWEEYGDAIVLTDDRVVIREAENDLWAFGTPWHGTAGIHKNIGIPIERIFFIEHGEKNRIQSISQKDAVNRLIVRSFPPFWNREAMQFAVNFCSRIVETKKCYELEFSPNISVIDFLRNSNFK